MYEHPITFNTSDESAYGVCGSYLQTNFEMVINFSVSKQEGGKQETNVIH